MMIRTYQIALAFALAATLSCGDDGGGGQDLPEGRSSVQPIIESLLRAQCEQLFSCCETGELSLLLGPVADIDDCTARYLVVLEAGSFPPYLGQQFLNPYIFRGLLSNGIRESALSADSAGIDACIASIAGAGCQMIPDGGERCTSATVPSYQSCALRSLFVGKLESGDACDVDIECGTDLRCVMFGTGFGVCAPSLDSGDLCFQDSDCSGQLVCDYQSGLCTDGAADGAACAFLNDANPVFGTETQRCQKGLSCNPISATCQLQYTCNFGSFCQQDSECPNGLYCVQSSCNLKAEVGETCSSQNQECQSNWCEFKQDQGEYICRATVATGAPCDSSQSASQCIGGYCDGTTSMCVAYGAEGVACPEFVCDSEAGFQCVDGACISYPLPLGDDCINHDDCASRNCDTTCMAALAIGASCTANFDSAACIDGSYCATNGQLTGLCEARKGHGQTCESSAECWGKCRVQFGVQRCNGVAPGQAVCDGT